MGGRVSKREPAGVHRCALAAIGLSEVERFSSLRELEDAWSSPGSSRWFRGGVQRLLLGFGPERLFRFLLDLLVDLERRLWVVAAAPLLSWIYDTHCVFLSYLFMLMYLFITLVSAQEFLRITRA